MLVSETMLKLFPMKFGSSQVILDIGNLELKKRLLEVHLEKREDNPITCNCDLSINNMKIQNSHVVNVKCFIHVHMKHK